MGYRHSRQELLDAAVDLACEDGLGQLTFRKVADRLGISDRMVVYYFPAKKDLIQAVVEVLAARLQALLASAFGDEPLSVSELLRRAWPVLAAPSSDQLFALSFEVIGLTSVKVQPFAELGPLLVDAWVGWLVPRIDSTDPVSDALGVVAVLDGLLLLRQISGPAAADAAARSHGILG